MTVSNTSRKAGPYLGNGGTTSFPFAFKVFDKTDLALTRTDAAGIEHALVLDSNYSIALNADQDTHPGGTITYPIAGAALATGETLVGIGATSATQGTDYVDLARFLPQIIEDSLDRLTILYQQVIEKVNRAVLAPKSESSIGALPAILNRANKFFGFDASGNPTTLSGTGADAALRTDLAGAGGAGMVNYAPGLTGSILRSVEGKLREFVSFKDFAGVTGLGVTDDSTGMQAAINAVQGTGVAIWQPAGTYLLAAALSVTASLTWAGAGNTASVLKLSTNTQDGVAVNSGGGKVTFRDCQIAGKTTATSGALVSLNGATLNLFASFDNVRFQDGWNQLFTIAAGSWTCNECLFISPNNTGCTIQNVLNLDGGDMGIFNSTFEGKGSGIAVLQFSAGGLRFIGNKVIAWADGYKLDMVAGVATADLFLIGNSFESFTGTAISLLKDAGSSFVAVHISDNEIAGTPNALLISGGGTWLTHLTVTENDFLVNTNGVCISITGVNSFSIGDNKLDSGGGTSVGLALGAGNSNGNIHDNRFHTLGTKITGVGTGTNIVIHDNPGYNPVGASNLAPAASPWTFTNGPTRADVYMAATTGITNITINGTQVLITGIGANINFMVPLGPNEVAVVTYAGTLTAKQMVH